MIGVFLGTFLVCDLAAYPEQMEAMGRSVTQHIQSLVADVEIDLDAPLSTDDE